MNYNQLGRGKYKMVKKEIVERAVSNWRLGKNENQYMQCCNCQAYIAPKDMYGEYVYNSFCPNCGARMEIVN